MSNSFKDDKTRTVSAGSAMSAHEDEGIPDHEYPRGSRLFLIVIAIILSIFPPTLDLTIVATAIPQVTDEFNGLDQASWYGSAFFLTNGSSQSAWGKAYKYFGLKTTFLVAMFVFELGSLVCAVAPNSSAFIAGRAIAGLGGAGLTSGAFIIIALIAPPTKRPIYTSLVGMTFGIAAVLGPLLGGAFTTSVTWRWCFYVNLPIGGVAALIIILCLRMPSSNNKETATSWKEKLLQLDLVGVVLMMCALLCFGLAIQRGGQTEPWSSSIVIGLLVGFVAILVVFFCWEGLIGARAMVPLEILARRAVCVNCVCIFFFTASYFTVVYYLPIYFQSIKGDSAILSGVHNLPLILVTTAAVIGGGAFVTVTQQAVPVGVLGCAIGTAGAGLLYTLDTDTSGAKWAGSQVLGALGWGMALQVPIVIVQSTASLSELPTITAIILFFLGIGSSLILLSAQSAFVNTIAATLRTNAPEIDVGLVIATGATEIRKTFDAGELPEILVAYMNGIKVVFAMVIAASGIALLVAPLNRWERLSSGETVAMEGAMKSEGEA